VLLVYAAGLFFDHQVPAALLNLAFTRFDFVELTDDSLERFIVAHVDSAVREPRHDLGAHCPLFIRTVTVQVAFVLFVASGDWIPLFVGH
jgi:hypothetical protein